MIVLRPEYKQVSLINHVRMSYEQIQQPWVDKIGHGVATNKHPPRTVMVSGKWVQNFLRVPPTRGIQYPVPAQIAYGMVCTTYLTYVTVTNGNANYVLMVHTSSLTFSCSRDLRGWRAPHSLPIPL